MIFTKKNLFALLVLTTSSAFAIVPEQNGTIKFEGEIYAATCTITINDINIEINPNPTMQMGRHPTSSFTGPNAESKATEGSNGGKLTIKAEDCPTQGSLKLKLTGETIDGSSKKLLKLSNYGTNGVAGNVAIVLYPEGKSGDLNLALSLDNSFEFSKISDFEKEITIEPYYRKIDDNILVKPGIANSTLDYSISYN